MRLTTAALFGCVAFTGAAWADEPAYEGDPNWSMRALLGYSKTGGNTDNSSANGLFHVAHVMGDWKVLFGIDALYGTTKGETTSQSLGIRAQANYNFSPKFYWYVGAGYLDDRFSGFAYQDALKTGVGYLWLRKEYLIKDAIGGVTERLNYDPNTGIPYEAEHSVAFDGAVAFEHSFNEYTKLLAAVTVLSSSENTLTTATVALQVKMSDHFALAAGYQLINNSDPPASSGHRDTLTTLSLVYDMKNPKLAPE